MRNLFNFIVRHFAWLVFIFYVIASLVLLIKSNEFQNYVFLTSANYISGKLHHTTNAFTSYLYLKDTNTQLLAKNAQLQDKIFELEKELNYIKLNEYADSIALTKDDSIENYIIAEVINNSISKPYNYILINKGSADGIKSEMGLVNQDGVIGIIDVVGENASRAISVLNPKFRLSCKVKNHDFFGSLIWHGGDPSIAYLEEMPRHVEFNTGDTIVTSGYSDVFPGNLPVGIIIDTSKDKDDNFLSFKVRLLPDFSQLNIVRVINNSNSYYLNDIVE